MNIYIQFHVLCTWEHNSWVCKLCPRSDYWVMSKFLHSDSPVYTQVVTEGESRSVIFLASVSIIFILYIHLWVYNGSIVWSFCCCCWGFVCLILVLYPVALKGYSQCNAHGLLPLRDLLGENLGLLQANFALSPWSHPQPPLLTGKLNLFIHLLPSWISFKKIDFFNSTHFSAEKPAYS